MRQQKEPMSEVENNEQNSENPEEIVESSSEAPLGTEETTPKSLRGLDLRYTEEDDVPSWAVGKTADEVTRMTEELYSIVQRGDVGSNSNGASETPMPQETTVSNSDVNSDLMYSNPAEYTRQLRESIRAEMRQELSGAAGPISTGMSSLAKRQSQADKRKIWDSYGPEIEAVMANVPVQNHGNVDLWNQAADIVAGRHVEEIARARAEELMSKADSGTLRTSEGSSAPTGATTRSPLQKLFDEKHPAVEAFIRDGIDAKRVEAHAAKMGHSPEAYAELLQKRVKVNR